MNSKNTLNKEKLNLLILCGLLFLSGCGASDVPANEDIEYMGVSQFRAEYANRKEGK